jgi:hypothetical protein
VPKKVARLDKVIHGYETQLQAGCTRVSQCRYDGGAFGHIVDRREYISSDLNHFSIKGHAKAAAVAWAFRALDRHSRRSSARDRHDAAWQERPNCVQVLPPTSRIRFADARRTECSVPTGVDPTATGIDFLGPPLRRGH